MGHVIGEAREERRRGAVALEISQFVELGGGGSDGVGGGGGGDHEKGGGGGDWRIRQAEAEAEEEEAEAEEEEAAAFIAEFGFGSFLQLDGVKSLFGRYQKQTFTLPMTQIMPYI